MRVPRTSEGRAEPLPFPPLYGMAEPGKPNERLAPGADVKERIEKPRMFRVLLHNDDYTTMEFVIQVLVEVFRKTQVEAARIMLTVHRSGKGIAGVYTREVAETKAALTIDRARAAGFPLLATTEPENG